MQIVPGLACAKLFSFECFLGGGLLPCGHCLADADGDPLQFANRWPAKVTSLEPPIACGCQAEYQCNNIT